MKEFFPFLKDDVCLCLSGGGALGFAHIGVLQALEENQIFPTQISGSSMGAIVGAFYAAGFKPSELLDLIKESKLYKMSTLLTFHPHRKPKGLSDHTTLKELIKKHIPHNSFEQLDKKLFVCVSNLSQATWEIKKSGDELDKWVAASASITGIFETIKHNDIIYTDGGLLNNMPAQPFENKFNTTIGVDVVTYTHLKEPPIEGLMNSLLTAVRAVQYQNSREGRDICKFLIEPLLTHKYYGLSFDDYRDIYQIGYDTATEYISKNKDILSLKRK